MPAARRTMRIFVELTSQATGGPAASQPPTLGEVTEPAALYGVRAAWAQLHGMITLEMFHHLQPIIGDTEAFFRAEVETLLDRLKPPNDPGSLIPEGEWHAPSLSGQSVNTYHTCEQRTQLPRDEI